MSAAEDAGWAAAYIHGVNLLDGLHHLTLEPLPVPILLPPGQRRRDTATITYRQSRRPIRGTVVANIPVTTSWRALFDLTVQAPDLTEAVVAADAFLAARVTTRETLLGIPDLLDVEAALALEYDGVRWQSGRSYGHRDREQHRQDNAREERLERAGLVVVRAEKADLTAHRSALVGRIRAAYVDGLARDRSRDRWTIDEPEGWFGLPF